MLCSSAGAEEAYMAGHMKTIEFDSQVHQKQVIHVCALFTLVSYETPSDIGARDPQY